MEFKELTRQINTAGRINVIGCTGSGKSTFSRTLAEKKGIKYIELDAIFWKDDWQETPDHELFPKLGDALQKGPFVLDGNYSRTQGLKWQQMDLIIWLNYPPLTVFSRLFGRSMQRALNKKPMWGTNNRESFGRTFFSSDSILLWFFKSYHRTRKKYRSIFNTNEYPRLKKIEITNPAHARAILDSVISQET